MLQRKIKSRVLFYSEGWGLGGIESFIMNTVESFQSYPIQFDIFCTHDWSDEYDSQLKKLGVQRYTVFPKNKPNLVKRLITSVKRWRSLLRENNYDIVHINTMNGTGFLYAHIAKQCGVAVRIVHSHNVDYGPGSRLLKKIVHFVSKMLWRQDATVRLACSKEAGNFLFDQQKFTIVRNGIDCNRFKFDRVAREQIRNKFSIHEGTLLFGSIGRISDTKNPIFQIDILRSLLDLHQKAMLLLVGDGPLLSKIIQYSEEKGVASATILPGATVHTEMYYSALDVFTMPSSFEGLGTAKIEALASGLPVLVNEHIPDSGFCSSYEHRLPLGEPNLWAQKIIKLSKENGQINRDNAATFIEDVGYGQAGIRAVLKSIYNII